MEGNIRSTYKYKNKPSSEPSKRTTVPLYTSNIVQGKTSNKKLASCFAALVQLRCLHRFTRTHFWTCLTTIFKVSSFFFFFFFLWAVKRPTSLLNLFCANSPGVGVLLYLSEHESVCYSFVTRMSVHKYSNNFRVHALACLANFSERIFSFLLSPDFLDHLERKRLPPPWRNSQKYRMFIIILSNHQNMSRNTMWLVNNTEFSLGHTETRLHCSFAKPFPWSSTNRPNFLKSDLVFELFHGYKDLAWQSSWWSILFCVYVYIHWSKAVALFAQFLSSLPERNSTNERRPWQNYMPRVQKTVSNPWKWKSQRTSHQFSYQQFARCLGNKRVQHS